MTKEKDMTEDNSHDPRGHYGIGIWDSKHPVNVGTIVRAAACFDADYVATIGGDKYTGKASDIKHSRHLPVFHYDSWEDMENSLPHDTEIILADYDSSAYSIDELYHPERAFYVMGNEAYGFTDEILERGYRKTYIPSEFCLNQGMAANIILRERYESERT